MATDRLNEKRPAEARFAPEDAYERPYERPEDTVMLEPIEKGKSREAPPAAKILSTRPHPKRTATPAAPTETMEVDDEVDVEATGGRLTRASAAKAKATMKKPARRKKDGLDMGAKKKRISKAAIRKEDSPAFVMAQELLDEQRTKGAVNPMRTLPTTQLVDRVVKATLTADGAPKWSVLTGNPEGKLAYTQMSEAVRRLVTGQPKRPHEYPMLGHHYAMNKEGEVHRQCHRLDWWREPSHPVGGIHMAELPKTAAEHRQERVARFTGSGGDHRLWSNAQKAAYARPVTYERTNADGTTTTVTRNPGPYRDWPNSRMNAEGNIIGITDSAARTASQQMKWDMWRESVMRNQRPMLYTIPAQAMLKNVK